MNFEGVILVLCAAFLTMELHQIITLFEIKALLTKIERHMKEGED